MPPGCSGRLRATGIHSGRVGTLWPGEGPREAANASSGHGTDEVRLRTLIFSAGDPDQDELFEQIEADSQTNPLPRRRLAATVD